jgi:hypothetical protein
MHVLRDVFVAEPTAMYCTVCWSPWCTIIPSHTPSVQDLSYKIKSNSLDVLMDGLCFLRQSDMVCQHVGAFRMDVQA